MLSDEHAGHLEALVTGGLMRVNPPPDVEKKLIEMGYARHAVGGLMPTDAAHKFLMGHKK